MRTAVEEFASARPDVEYLGPQSRAGMRSAVDSASAVIVASLWPDVLPTIAIEALAAGRPVLGTSLGGIPWVVGDAGWIVDPEAFTGGLADATRDLADPAVAAALSTRARARYETAFTPAVGTKALVDLYAALAGSGPGSGSDSGPGPGRRTA
jgi:glycosyltransferase involved in cell wall biosynthesis